MRAWLNLHNPPACSNFKTVAGAKFELACQTSTPSQRFERRLRMPFKRGAANTNFSNLTSTRWAVKNQHDPDRAQASGPTSSGPASNPPPQHFHCGLSSCGIELISSTTGRPLLGVSICTSCCGVVWCAGCFLVSFIERLPNPIKSHSVASLLQLSDSRLAQSTAVLRERRV